MRNISFLIISLTLCACFGKKPHPKTGHEGKAMPEIDLILIDSVTHFNTTSIPPGTPSMLFSFEPWCPYCRAQMESILSNYEKFGDVKMVFLCKSPYSEFKAFYEKHKLNRYPNITAGIDYKMTFANYFQTDKIPYLAFYDPNKKLSQVIVGKSRIGTILDVSKTK